jgi:hypothetical protein
MGHNFKFQADYHWLYRDTWDSGVHLVRIQGQFYL